MSTMLHDKTRAKPSPVMVFALWGIVVYFYPCRATHLPNKLYR